MTEKRAGTDEFRKNAKRWRNAEVAFYFLHYFLGVLALALSTLMASKSSLDASIDLPVRWLLSLATALLTFLAAKSHAEKYRGANEILKVQIGRYDVDQTYTYNDVAEASNLGHDIIRGRISAAEGRGVTNVSLTQERCSSRDNFYLASASSTI